MGLPEDLAGLIPESARRSVPRRYDVIGDIAVLSLPGGLHVYGPEIAGVILRKRRHIRTVLNKTARIAGDKRVASFDTLAGQTTVTTHREFGISYRLDLSRVFFNPSLASERNRIATQAAPGETVLVPFAGIGPFVIPLAKKDSNVIAVENNPDAVLWLQENICLNGVCDRVRVIAGNAFDRALYGDRLYDRAVIPTPYGMDDILDSIYPAVRNRGMIHFYTFKKSAQILGLIESFREKGLETARWRRCGNVAPGVHRLVFDLVKL
jgi:tRNA (guanine37-N1)-methyltransferase